MSAARDVVTQSSTKDQQVVLVMFLTSFHKHSIIIQKNTEPNMSSVFFYLNLHYTNPGLKSHIKFFPVLLS